MHPTLVLDDSKIPAAIRDSATRAVNGSSEDLARLHRDFATETNRDTLLALWLPVCYANLNPADIPETLEDGEPLPGVVARAATSIGVLQLIGQFSLDVGVDLWPRIWSWISFVHTHIDAIHETSELDTCAVLLVFVAHLISDKRCARVVGATAGVRALITRAWKLLRIDRKTPPSPACLVALHSILRESFLFADAGCIAESIEGAGGTLTHLTRLSARYIEYFIPPPGSIFTMDALMCIDAVLIFITDVVEFQEPATPAIVAAELPKFVTSLTWALATTAQAANRPPLQATLDSSVALLCHIIAPSPPCRAIQQALSAGLLRLIAHCGIRGIYEQLVSRLLVTILPPSLVYPALPPAFNDAFRAFDDRTTNLALRESPIHSVWSTLRHLTDDRLALLEFWKANYVSQKACDNMTCGAIRQTRNFHRCGNCHRVYYCSRRCQRIDWKRGGHRLHCASMRSFALKYPDSLSPRTLSFMRVVMRHHYLSSQVEILGAQLAFRREHPTDHMVTVFDFASNPVRAIVHTISVDSMLQPQFGGVDCVEHIRRAARSGGRMELQIMSVPNGRNVQARMFSMRSITAALHDGIRRLATRQPATSDVRAVARLIAAGPKNGSGEIHL
ncbi:hypothetical protein DFH09DRAFT_1315637 [Mycena vulgaris]|nr:hypothetical protein DFH09DRAFT_1315637 [Mycena vulgaris]